MEEARDGRLLVEPVLGREGQRVDAAELAVEAVLDQPLDGVDDGGVRADCRSTAKSP